MKKDLFKNLTEEQVIKARNCKNSSELLDLIGDEGIELTDEQLEVVSGGGGGCEETKAGPECPYCGSTHTMKDLETDEGTTIYCADCRQTWKINGGKHGRPKINP